MQLFFFASRKLMWQICDHSVPNLWQIDTFFWLKINQFCPVGYLLPQALEFSPTGH